MTIWVKCEGCGYVWSCTVNDITWQEDLNKITCHLCGSKKVVEDVFADEEVWNR